MNGENESRETRAQWIFAVGLVILAFLFLAASLYYESDSRFRREVAPILWRSLWPILWLPGAAMCYVLFLRMGDISLFIGALLQVVASGIYSVTGRHLGPAAALGYLGLLLPFFDHHKLRWFTPRWAFVLQLIVLLALTCIPDWAPYGLELVVWLWAHYARIIWPSLDRALIRLLRSETRKRRKSKFWR